MANFNDDFTLLELEQIRNSREYQDQRLSGPGAESGCDLNADLNEIFSSIRRIIYGNASGVGNWFDAVPAPLSDLVTASGVNQQNITNIETFIGKTGPSGQPHFNCTTFYSQNVSLKEATDSLCQALESVSGQVVSATTQTLDDVFQEGNGILNVSGFNFDIRIHSNHNINVGDTDGSPDIAIFSQSGVQIRQLGFREHVKLTSNVNPGDILIIPNNRLYTPGDKPSDQYPNLEVYFNGNLFSPGSGINSGDKLRRDYVEHSPSSIKMNRKLQASTGQPARIIYRIYG